MKIKDNIKRVEKLILNINKIIDEGAFSNNSKMLDGARDMTIQTKQLIRTLFSDATDRMSDFVGSMKNAVKRDRGTKYFKEQAKVIRRYLVVIKDSLESRETIELKESKLDKIDKKLREMEVESKRREKVAETKFWGASIEMIDKLREQIKEDGTIKEEIINIKTELKEIKEMLVKIKKI